MTLLERMTRARWEAQRARCGGAAMAWERLTEAVRAAQVEDMRPALDLAIAAAWDGDMTAEVLRCCVLSDAPKGTCSFLYATAWRAARALGWRRLITYTLADESGASLRGAGWRTVAELPPRPAHRAWKGPGRDREWQPVFGQQKLRWEVAA